VSRFFKLLKTSSIIAAIVIALIIATIVAANAQTTAKVSASSLLVVLHNEFGMLLDISLVTILYEIKKQQESFQ